MSEKSTTAVGKYGSLIQKARESQEPEKQNSSDSEMNAPGERENNPSNQTETGPEPEAATEEKLVNQKTRKPENQKTRKLVNQKTGKPENQDEAEMVNLSIKVSKQRRRHWSAEAKRLDTTLVAAISQALSEKFGEPQD